MGASHSNPAGSGWYPTPSDAFPGVWGDWTRLNSKWSCRFSFVGGRLRCVWNAAKPPTPQQLQKVSQSYRQARDAFFEELSAKLEVQLVVIERADPEVRP